MSLYSVGDRVRTTVKPHMKGMGGVGTVKLVEGNAYGILFDAMPEMGVHKWYVESELAPAEDAPRPPTPKTGPEDDGGSGGDMKKSMKMGRSNLGVFVHTAKSETGAKAKWQPMFPLGAVKHRSDFPGGRLDVDAAFCRAMVANYQRMGKPRLAGNYFHRDGDMAPADVPIEQLVKSGTIVDVQFREADEEMPGVWALVEWTPRGAGYVASGEIDQISPEWSMNYRDRNSNELIGPALLGFGLVQAPLFKEMPRAAASDAEQEQSNQADEAATTGAVMNKKLIALLGLAENATDEQIERAVKTRDEAFKASTGLNEKLTATVAVKDELTGKLKAAESKVAELQKELETEKNKAAEAAKHAAADKFADELRGKGIAVPSIEKLKKLHLTDPETAKSLAADLQPAANVKPAGVDGDGKGLEGKAAEDALFKAAEKIKVEEKVDFSEARRRASQRNPELAKAAFKSALTSTPTSEAKA